MKITIDCRHINSSGIGVYLKECLQFLLDSGNEFQLLGYTNDLIFVSNHPNIELINCTIKPFSLRDTFLFPRRILKKINHSDAFYSPYFNIPCGIEVPIYTTIHDIIFPDMPELTSRLGLLARMFFYRRSFQRSKKIFTVSHFSKSRIVFYSRGKKSIIVTSNAIKSYLFKNHLTAEEIKKKEYILFIGNIKRHKGLNCLLEAFFEAKKHNLRHSLVIIGNETDFRSKDNFFHEKLSAFKSEEVKFLYSVSDNELRYLLAEASLLVQPSLYEGFGLPPLEAMFFGTKALISDIPVFHEIYNEFPVTFFKTGDPNDLKEKLLLLLLDKEPERIHLSDELKNKYSYKETSETIIREISD